jgi:hypothetical protein
MKKEYWDVTEEQVLERTGKKISEWAAILDKYNAEDKKANAVADFLQTEYDVPRYWARILTTNYFKSKIQ